MVQSTEITRLKAIIKRRDAVISELKATVKKSTKRECELEDELETLLQQQKDFKCSLINFLNLDEYIRNVVRESI